MNVKMLVAISGNPTANVGQIVDLPDDEAERFIAAGFAKPSEEPAEVFYEVARAAAAPERAQGRKAKQGS